ncbi:hypothetical protein K435DRAFT_754462 [Dendrothele bispora CBS 962.96]|uniref:Alpha/beta-hydrolase n=1 Tax=Dendrothele bispora (strain CBS 962.96) TaxID=1314807 RepID=A0A4S8M4J6_DENBC|nr:hypothetical protein K435DRAFT_754462 [Dendrothele bispora CBS 962.96]
MAIATRFSLFLFLTFLFTLSPVSAWDWIQNPAVNGGQDDGWQSLPELPGAQLITDWPVPGTSSVMPVYQSAGLDTSRVTRAIIVPGAKARDHWSYWVTMQNIKMDFASTNSSFDPNTTSILTPCFLAEQDIEAGAGKPDQLYWGKTSWFGGYYTKGPNADDKISSFDVLDSLVDYYTNETMYPNMQTVIFAGHSAAAQFFQRYAAVRQPTKNDDRVNYIIANPGSYLWLVQDRPAQNSSCPDVDEYKYGLNNGLPGYSTGDYSRIGRDGIVSRYLGRNVHYALGTNDNGPGDTQCQALTQGSTHLERGNNFIAMLKALPDGMPSQHTVDMIEGVSHQNDQMFNSTQLRQRLFKDVSTTTSAGTPQTTQNNANTSSKNNGALSSKLISSGSLGIAMTLVLGGLSL